MPASVKAHVICSKHFIRHLFTALFLTVSLFVLVSSNNTLSDTFGDGYENIKIRIMHKATSLKYWGLVSLLSSACCALQLFLNIFSVGCAGFNTYLGPLRPIFLSLALCGQIYMWREIKLDSQYPSAIKATLLTATVSFMPECLYIYHYIRGKSLINTPSTESSSTTTTNTKQIVLKLQNMGCLACVNTITNVIQQCKGVIQVQVRLDDGEADVTIVPTECNVTEMCNNVNDVGFPASVSNEESKKTDGTSSKTEATQATQATQATDTPTDTTTDTPTDTPTTYTILSSIFAGLISSSCCALQLGLNVLSSFNILHIGCAGFNKVLGPLRGITRSISIGWLSFLWYKHRSNKKQHSHLIVSTTITLLLMLLPEILKLSGGPALAPPTNDQMILEFNVPNMGCEACENNVKKIVGRQNGVIDSSIDFEGGSASMYYSFSFYFYLIYIYPFLVI